jgi:CheY-like chemotaxis protein
MADTVLVVEDDRANAVLIETILTSFGGFEVMTTDDGDEVMRIVTDDRVAAVVMDVSLGHTRVAGDVVDGVELTRRIRTTASGAHLPVILLTAHAMRGDREHLLFSSGANDYVAKPITDQRAFVELVGRHIRSHHAIDSTGSVD